jgi:agmatine/peptidylarginine deiminase
METDYKRTFKSIKMGWNFEAISVESKAQVAQSFINYLIHNKVLVVYVT